MILASGDRGQLGPRVAAGLPIVWPWHDWRGAEGGRRDVKRERRGEALHCDGGSCARAWGRSQSSSRRIWEGVADALIERLANE